MLLASYPRRHSSTPHHRHLDSFSTADPPTQTSSQSWYPLYSTPITPTQTVYDLSNCDPNFVLPLETEQNGLVDYDSSPQTHNLNDLRIQVHTPFGSSQDQDLMQSEHSIASGAWHFSNGQLTPTSARTHHRESSLSSLGSAGPASPYNHNTSHPQVVLPSDSVGEVYYDGLSASDQIPQYQIYSKTLTPSQTPQQDAYGNHTFQQNLNLPSYHSDPHYVAVMALHNKQHAGGDDDSSLHAPDYAHSGRPSVASSHDSPATPPAGEEYEDHHRKLDFRQPGTIPKLDRTMSDAYNDELYNPNFTFTSAPASKTAGTMISPSHQSGIFSQRLQAANNQHLNASAQQAALDQSRGRSPFRQGSPLAPPATTFASQGSSQIRLGSEAQLREQQRAENDVRTLQEQMERTSQHSTPKTISPKDALLEYHETEEDSSMPLFPPQSTSHYGGHNIKHESSQPDFDDNASQQSFRSMATSRRESSAAYSSSQTTPQAGQGFNFAPPSVPGGVQIPQQYPFIPQQRRQPSTMSSVTDRAPEFPSSLASMDSSSSEYIPESSDSRKPAGASADTGTYTCTYHGCTLRFETPAKLQKHKREGHRQATSMMGTSPNVSGNGNGMTAVAQSQSGPHRCDRISPSTGKPCNVVFSRPYDLTRHEDTIHNARKQKVRCHICTEEKTFSRNDALTRHFRVVHPEIQLPGKTRRRTHD